jgi:signal recognition particle subunit SRP54
MNDLLSQMKQMQKMGPLGQLINMFPGLSGKVSDDDVAAGEKQLKRIESMIYSMTPAERAKPSIINPSRKRRIAAGSGTKVEDVNRLLKQFEQMQKMMKQLGGLTGGKGKRRKMMAQLSQMTGGGGFPMM